MTGRSDVAAGDSGSNPSRADAAGANRQSDRRGPGRPLGDSKLPAHIMAAVRQTIHAAAATCVDPSRLEASGPYEWLAIVESRDEELYGLLRGFIEASRYLDELEHHNIDVGHIRLSDAIRKAEFAKDSLGRSLGTAIRDRAGRRIVDI